MWCISTTVRGILPLGKLPLGKLPPGKLPLGKLPPRNIATRKIATIIFVFYFWKSNYIEFTHRCITLTLSPKNSLKQINIKTKKKRCYNFITLCPRPLQSVYQYGFLFFIIVLTTVYLLKWLDSNFVISNYQFFRSRSKEK